jgi:hypothetical protein
MSQSYSLYCEATKQKCWAGQSSHSTPGGVLVYSAPDEAAAIARFLQATAGHPVVLMEDERVPLSWCLDFEEFNDPGDDDVVDKPSHLP